MEEFPGLPGDIYAYENQFNYAVWTPNTRVTMCNVPWDSSYRDIVRFDTQEAKAAWFKDQAAAGYAFILSGMVYLRYNEPIRVNIPFDQASRCNYIMVENPGQPVPGALSPSVFYYFVQDVTYIAPNTTQLNVQLDVWMTYYDRVHFSMCYVNRGHIGIANANANINNLTWYMTETEGLNIGDEYEVVHQTYWSFAAQPPWVLFMCSADLTADWGTIANPNLNSANGTSGGGIIQGCEVYCCDFQNFRVLMQALQRAPWVSQCINYITVVPSIMLNKSSTPTKIQGADVYELALSPIEPVIYSVTNAYANFSIPSRYKNLLKFYTSPYTSIEITYLNGGEIVLKPECLTIEDTPTQQVDFVLQAATVPPDVRAVFFPRHYNAGETRNDLTFKAKNGAGAEVTRTFYDGEGLDMALTITNFPQVSVVNNMYAYYMASTVHSRNYAFETADWSQQKAMMGADTVYSLSSNSMATQALNQSTSNQLSRQLNQLSQEQNWANWGLNSVSGIVGGAVGGGLAGAGTALAGAAVGAAGTAINNAYSQMANTAQIGAATEITAANIKNQGFARDTNYDYAKFAAEGDYQNAIQAIQAKVQDARLTQPTTSGQNGGDMFNVANGYQGVLIKWKRLKHNFVKQVGDYWLRYGYYINRWMVPPKNLKCCENFTYWKIQETSLTTSQVPELFRETIRGIFEKGVTVWSNPDKIGRVDLADNEPVQGVYY